ncbi:MAG: 1-acyl-sn-glycerol-3-phosphate acyltransferase [Sulfitobacter sp.]
MNQTVIIPLWLFVLIVLFAAVTALSHFLLPSVRWFFRRRLEKAVARLNTRLTRPIEPFRLARRYDMIQRLSYDPDVSREISNYARKHGVPENVAFQKAQEYAREIVPSFSAFTYFSFGTRAARMLARSVYRIRTGEQNDAIFAAIPADSTVIFVMNHRSNMDYVLVTYLAARASALSYAVGEWARVWPLSLLIRSMGAYFIRRKSRGALYRKVLARYVQLATEGGVTQGIYPEGGLSLTGALQPPKVGLLSYHIEGFDPDQGASDVVFVPVAINYDRVLEDRVLIAAHRRGDRRFGARITVVVGFILRKLWQRLRGQDTRFGTAAVAFGAPVSLRGAGKIDAGALGDLIMQRIEAAMPVLGVPLLATQLVQGPRSADQLLAELGALLPRLPAENIALDPARLQAEIARSLRHMQRHGLIEQRGDTWHIQAGEGETLQFYANSIAHFLPDDAAPAKENAASAGS